MALTKFTINLELTKSYLEEVFDFFCIITVTFSANTLHLLNLASFTSSLKKKKYRKRYEVNTIALK